MIFRYTIFFERIIEKIHFMLLSISLFVLFFPCFYFLLSVKIPPLNVLIYCTVLFCITVWWVTRCLDRNLNKKEGEWNFNFMQIFEFSGHYKTPAVEEEVAAAVALARETEWAVAAARQEERAAVRVSLALFSLKFRSKFLGHPWNFLGTYVVFLPKIFEKITIFSKIQKSFVNRRAMMS